MTLHARRLAPVLFVVVGLLQGCTVLDSTPNVRLDAGARWVLLPFTNATETPLAANRAEAVTEGVLRALGVAQLVRYPASINTEALFEGSSGKSQEQAQAWAREQGARYAISGSVDEWRYKVGVDGEPAVGLHLQVVDMANGQTVWSGTGAKSGWSRESLAGVAQKLVKALLAPALKRS